MPKTTANISSESSAKSKASAFDPRSTLLRGKATDTTLQLFNQDIVQILSSPEHLGVVLRCWHDAEDTPPIVPPTDPLMRPLAYGEVGVTYLSRDMAAQRAIFHEHELRLVDRILQPGDYCKRSIDDVQSGVVLDFKTRARIVHAISGAEIPGWHTREDMEDRVYADTGDYVMYDDWIGQIIEVFDESLVERANGQLIRLRELGGRMAVGQQGTDLTEPFLHDPMCPSTPSKKTKGIETVLDVKHNVYAVAWLALNQSLDPAVAETKSRPKRFWFGEDLSKLMLITDRVDLELRVGDVVKLKNKEGVPVTHHGVKGMEPGTITIDALWVTRTESHIDVLWQDGKRETLRSVDLIPYLNPDEYDCWPGDQLLWKNEDETHSAIVQSVNAVDRTAQILLSESGKVDLAPLLELDANGMLENDAQNDGAPEGLGVRVGDFVFIHNPGADNGLTPPKVPRIGELEPWVREHPFTDGKFGGWRREMQAIGAAQRQEMQDKIKQRRANLDNRLTWCGEVTELCLDGAVKVTHADTTVGIYPLNRLTRLYDGIEQLEDEAWDAGTEVYSDDETEQMWTMDTDGNWTEQVQDGDWEDVASNTGSDQEEDVDVEMTDDGEQGELSEDDSEEEFMEVEEHLWPDDEDVPQPAAVEPQPGKDVAAPSGAPVPESPPTLEKEVPSAVAEETSNFEIIPSAPPDHAFFSTPPGQPSKQFLGRLSKEYRVLRSSLPDSIIVRAFEDRTDLLRCMIIGPENTPYQDAPFVIDWMLDSNFPNSPPRAHFLSWTNGNGRVNPNLYEEGKVCLSILGTWSGDKNEIWSAARSSLLQAFVSIQGLVLVKEPWFCEPAYEKLRGTQEGTVNSRLYSEKAYVLSRGFVRRALEIPLGGLEDEVKNLYYKEGLLRKVLKDADKLIEQSKQETQPTTDNLDLAVPRLSGGGIIMLERTLTKLRALLQNYASKA